MTTDETEADIVREIKPGMFVWFADDSGEGFREATKVTPWTAGPYGYERDLAEEWVTVTYTDGHIASRPRYGTHEIWKSGPRPVVGAA
jgi:hypothetical protein